jgi:hypothetical protein
LISKECAASTPNLNYFLYNCSTRFQPDYLSFAWQLTINIQEDFWNNTNAAEQVKMDQDGLKAEERSLDALWKFSPFTKTSLKLHLEGRYVPTFMPTD